ncbi:MAG: M4 family metallopeptidase, partial [Thermoanaerobaculia bacterium]
MKKLILAIAMVLLVTPLYAGIVNVTKDVDDGMFIVGDLGQLPGGPADEAAVRFLQRNGQIIGAMGTEEHVARMVRRDQLGMTHVRVQQRLRGLPVIGAELIVHSDSIGRVHSINGSFVADRGLPRHASVNVATALDQTKRDMGVDFWTEASNPDLVYVINGKGQPFLAWRMLVAYTSANGEKQVDWVFADATTGHLVAIHPTIHRARNRQTYSANNGTTLPGTLRISETGALTGDAAIDSAHTYAGVTYNYYMAKFSRDSYNAAGATIKSTAHYSSNYSNAYWNGSQMVYGDGDGTTFIALSRALDVVAHELTHAVTDTEANLTYQNESGALNEAMSDIFAAATESYNDGAINSDTWKIGEDVYTPGTAGDALRYMNNPTADGQSYDYYPERYTGTADYGGVHLNSGIANLAFYLLVQGGSHPRSKTTVVVPAIGMAKAEAIFYRALTLYMTSSTNFQGARNTTAQAATDLYGAASAELAALHKAWDAVGVPGTPGGGDTVVTLSNGVTVSGIGASTGTWKHYKITVPSGQSKLEIKISGGTGDCDLYVKRGAQPTSSSYDYRPYLSGNNETVTVTNPVAGDWYVSLYAYSTYASVSLVATYSTTAPPPTCTTYTGTLSGTGTSSYKPSSTGYVSSVSGTHTGKLTGTGTDFDLYLQKLSGTTWSTV